MVSIKESSGVLAHDQLSNFDEFEIDEPLMDNAKEKERRHGMMNLLARYRKHLLDKYVHHLGKLQIWPLHTSHI